jgi:hypothetical protein
VDVTVIAIISTSAASVLTVTVRSLFRYLREREQIQLARHIFDASGSTAGLTGYTELRHTDHPVIIQIQQSSTDSRPSSPPSLPPSPNGRHLTTRTRARRRLLPGPASPTIQPAPSPARANPSQNPPSSAPPHHP